MASPPLAAVAAAAAAGSGDEASSGSGDTATAPPGRDLAALFEQAAERVPALLPAASKEQLLYLYARYKQVRRDRGGPAQGRSPGTPRPAPGCGRGEGPGRRSGAGAGPGTRVGGPGAVAAGGSGQGPAWPRHSVGRCRVEEVVLEAAGNGAARSFWSGTKFGTAGFSCGGGRCGLVGQSPANFSSPDVLPHLSPALSTGSPNAVPPASVAKTSVWLQWREVGHWCGGFGLCLGWDVPPVG